jgi:hypothetical protein
MSYRSIGRFATVFVCVLCVKAQETKDVLKERRVEGFAVAGVPAGGRVSLAPSGATFHFIAAEGFAGGKVVEGAPYTADGHTEFSQILGDGTRISRKNVSSYARDSKGRTRFEHTLSVIGPWAASGEAQRVVSIYDPVAKESIILDEKDKTARRIKMPAREEGPPLPRATKGVTIEREVRVIRRGGERDELVFGGPPVPLPLEGERIMFLGGPDGQSEPLGKQMIEGLLCEGTRTSHTIPAGQIGNDRPITVTHERWFSPELQVTVMSRTTDPLHGDTTYRLTNIKRGEPSAALFQVPAGYTVIEDAHSPLIIQRRLERQP